MKPGDVVKVYQKPITREDFEGTARVVRVLSRRAALYNGIRYYSCVVNFPEDGPDTVVTRQVGEPGGTP